LGQAEARAAALATGFAKRGSGNFPISAVFRHRSDRRRAFKQQSYVANCFRRGVPYRPGGRMPGAMERAMGEAEFDRIVDAGRKEIALAPAAPSLTGLRAFDWRAKVPGKPASGRRASVARIRHVGEGRKRYR
jgi:hypothetical protein